MNASYAVWLAISGLISLLVAWLSWRRRAASGALPLMTLMLLLSIWAWMYAAHWLSITPAVRKFWLDMTYFGVAFAPVAFFVLVQDYIGRGAWLTKRAYALLLTIPILTLILLWTDPLHGWFFGQSRNTDVIFNGGPWFYVFVFYSYGLMAIGVFLLGRAYMRASEFYRRQTRVMLIGALLPWTANIILLLGWGPVPQLDLTPFAFTGTGLIFAYGFFGYRMMDLVPVGRDALVESIDDAIVVVDTYDRIVDINPKAMDYADPGLDHPFGRPFREVYSRWADVFPDYAGLEGRAEVKLTRPPFSFFEFSITSLKDRQDQLMGKLITWRDITAHKEAAERLRVFFRTVEQNPVAILITNPNGIVEYVNPHFTRLTGYVLEDLRGKTPRVLQSGKTSLSVYENLWMTIGQGQVWDGEFLNRKKNGETYWVHEVIAPVEDDEGNLTHFVAMQQDITESRQAAEKLRIANERLQVHLTEIEQLHAQLREEAIRDSVTRLYNRRYMEETLEREISRGTRGSQTISVVMMDVDQLKFINDTFGHQAGDAVLQTLGTILLENSRASDIACRYGGDEILVVMPGATQEVAMDRAEEWRKIFSQMDFDIADKPFAATLSVGVATFPDHAQESVGLLNASDKALYWAKVTRNRVVQYDPSTMARSQHHSNEIR